MNNNNKNNIKGFQQDISKARNKTKDDFFTWFNKAKDANHSFIQGYWDFAYHILFPVAEYISNPEEKSILEIGHGGGRMLAAASKFFKNAIGIDIHNENDFVLENLNERGIRNVKLLRSNGESIPLDDQVVDVVYTFIVLQHVGDIKIFKNYIKETYRVLRNNGIAILYFGRYYKFSYNKDSKLLYYIDRIIEKLSLKKGYIEIPAKVNHTNLKVSLSLAKKISKRQNFKILKVLVSRKKSSNLLGGQNGLILKK